MSRRTIQTAAILLLACLMVPALASAQSIIANLSPRDVQEAIAAGKRGEPTGGSLRTGPMGKKRFVGSLTTPWTRVAGWAELKYKDYEDPKASEVPESLLVPVAVVWLYAMHETPDDTKAIIASPTKVVILPAKGTEAQKRARMIQPLYAKTSPRSFKTAYGTDVSGTDLVAFFPLDALSEDRDFRVVYDRGIQFEEEGYSIACSDCRVDIKLKGLK